MEFKKLILVLVVTTTIIFGCLWGSTYAYYTYNNGTSVNVTTGSVNTGVAVVFSQSEYMNIQTGVPITEDDVDTYASKTVFTLTPDSNILSGYDVAVTVNLINFTIDPELLVADFRYNLSCSDGTNTNLIMSSSGNVIHDDYINNKVLPLGTLSTSNGTFDVDKTYTCTIRVWLHETGSNQNNLMDRSFSGLVKVNSVFRKQ